mgnify:CR=1 FL=1
MTISPAAAKAATLEYFNNDELATDVWLKKYALRTKQGELLETTPNDMHDRIAAEFMRMEMKFAMLGRPRDGTMQLSDVRGWLQDFRFIVPQGSPMTGIGNDEVVLSLSNCAVVDSPVDSIDGIYKTLGETAQLFKRRCGVGVDLSNLRPEGALVNNAARSSSGAWSFADLLSHTCRLIGTDGRRGALMISLDVRHPDVLQFIKMKSDLGKVTGANVSLRLTDGFMEAVDADESFELRWPCTGVPEITQEVQARDIWKEIIKAATNFAEPGLLFWDNLLKMLPAHCYPEFFTLTVNPCGEIALSAYDCCRLISMCLKHVVDPFTSRARINWELLGVMTAAATRMSDNLVELELEKIAKIIDSADSEAERELWKKFQRAARQGRRIGLGSHGLADMLARMQLAYDSDEAIALAAEIDRTIKLAAYRESVELAIERGPFPAFDWEQERHCEFFKSFPSDLLAAMAKHGRRNISLLTKAPTGSVSIESQCSSSSEPVFRNVHKRRKKINHNERDTVADFIDAQGDRWVEFDVYHHNAREWQDLHPGQPLPDYFVESDKIDWLQRVRMQAAIQQHVDHSISSTINLPRGTTEEQVGKIYMEAWKQGLKGVTVYVEGSRDGVLLSKDEPEAERSTKKRPKGLEAEIAYPRVKDEEWMLVVGLLDGKPYELFCGRLPEDWLTASGRTGSIVRRRKGCYQLQIENGTDKVQVIEDFIDSLETPEQGSFNRMISTMLRHEVPIEFIVEQLQKERGGSFSSMSKVLSRYLKRFITDGTERKASCPSCGHDKLIYQEGCLSCTQCGYAKCG